MISYKESLKILQEVAESIPQTQIEEVSLSQAVGRILAEEVVARENNPSFDNAAMDGFAVNISTFVDHLNSPPPWIPVQTVVGAGDAEFHIHERGGAIEIMTGAPIPSPDFDSVVRIEDVEVKRDLDERKLIRINLNPKPGDNIRRTGEDMKPGAVLLKKNTQIKNEHLLALATQGISRLKVKKKIKIGIISTGKEIVDHETECLRPGQIRNSTGVYLQAVLSDRNFEVKNYGIVRDDPAKYLERLNEIFNDDVEILLSTGAVSLGVYDFIKPALKSVGAKVHFHKCAIRPGKPVLFASILYDGKTRFIFGMPGNPIATLAGLRFVVRPFIDLLLTGEIEKSSKAILVSDTRKPEGLRCFFTAKVILDGAGAWVEALKSQASFMVSPILQSNAWVVLPEDGDCVQGGTQVEVFFL